MPMTEIGGNVARNERPDPLELTKEAASMVLRESVELFCVLEGTVGSDDPPSITILVLSPEESAELHSGIDSRLKVDLGVMYSLALCGLWTPLNEGSVLEDYINIVRFSHYKNHPRSRSAFRSKEAMDLAMEAYLEAPGYEPPDRSLPTLEEIFPTS